MQKVLVFTDLHILPDGGRIIGLDPSECFSEGLTHALGAHPDAAHIVITGDLTHHGTTEEYARLRDLLADCPLPVTLMLGNHDRRGAFGAVFAHARTDPAGFVQDMVVLEDTCLVMLDTLDETAPDLHSGWLCNTRLEWLDNALRHAVGRRVVLFMHHPPAPTGFANMDAIALRDPERLAKVLARHDNVSQIVAGHVHRTCQTGLALGSGRHVPVTIFKSPCHQMGMDLQALNPHLSVAEPGAYGLLLLMPETVVVHTEDFALNTPVVEGYGD